MQRVAIVTGASRGIGKQIAIGLGRAGFDVVVAARTVEAHKRLPGTIGATVAAVEETGARSLAVRTDMTSPADVTALVARTIDEFGRLDVVVNDAADTSGGSPALVDLAFEEWERQFDTNLHGPLRLMQAAVPHLQAAGRGVIVNMSSSAGDLVEHDWAERPADPSGLGGERLAYAASKAALNRLANAVAPQLAAAGIAVVNVDPGFTRTELVDLMSERGLVDPRASVPMDVPTRTVLHIATSGDAMRWSGRILRAADFVAEHGL